ncbi:MAG: protein translocase subunit SecD [Candidatus Aureabacteria bacterium]|nr:protein translocase subunit SecD [Candidatus Auribacterota bacterium]
MDKTLKFKWTLIVVIIGVCIWLFWPPQEKLNFGLDLKGGTHMILEVDTTGIDQKDVSGVVDGTRRVLKNRIDPEGIRELEIRSYDNRIFIQIPDIKDIDKVRSRIHQTALLEFCLVNNNPEDIKKARSGENVPGYRLATFMESEAKDSERDEEDILIKSEPELTGKYLAKAKSVFGGSFNEPMVGFEFDSEGSRRFALVTKENKGERLAILLDGLVISAPVIKDVIHKEGVIKGSMTVERAKEIALLLTSGALPAPVEIISETTVSPTLGADSIRKGIYAAVYGLIAVVMFMALYYLLAGFIADFALLLNLVILIGVLAFFDATITLPGIAGIILTIGMSVDANVLIFERIREEQKAGKKIKTAISHGYNRAFRTILDANLTTLLTALILYWKGTGPIKGFGVTLSVGIATSMFTALFVTRAVFDSLTSSLKMENLKMLQFFSEPKIPFLSFRKLAYIFSIVLIAGGLFVFFIRGDEKYGIDFTGGTVVQVKFDEKIKIEDLRDMLKKVGLGKSTIQYFGIDKTTVIIKTSMQQVNAVQDVIKENLKEKSFSVERVEQIGPAIGKELRTSALVAFTLAILGILLYITWRFEFRFAIAAIIALVHDVLVTAGAVAVLGYFTGREINLPVIAALLTIIGYSLNDTIVVFDRIREDLKLMKQESYENIINISINQTLSRTLLTSLTTLFVVLCLYLFGGVVINGFAFTLLIGIIIGTYSSIFIASPLLFEWQKKLSTK